jgi:hypothetical protein
MSDEADISRKLGVVRGGALGRSSNLGPDE